jgi:hypothetical protein
METRSVKGHGEAVSATVVVDTASRRPDVAVVTCVSVIDASSV